MMPAINPYSMAVTARLSRRNLWRMIFPAYEHQGLMRAGKAARIALFEPATLLV